MENPLLTTFNAQRARAHMHTEREAGNISNKIRLILKSAHTRVMLLSNAKMDVHRWNIHAFAATECTHSYILNSIFIRVLCRQGAHEYYNRVGNKRRDKFIQNIGRARARNPSQTRPILFITLKSARMPSDGGGRRNEVAGHEKNRFNLFERVRRSCRRARV